MSGIAEVWRMFRSDSSFETVVAVGTLLVWLFLTHRKVSGEERSAGGNRLNR